MTRVRIALLAVVALVGATAVAAAVASQRSSPQSGRDAVLADAARQLGVDPAALREALQQALQNRVDAAVADGRLTEEQGERLKQRIEKDRLPLFPGSRRLDRHGRPFGATVGKLGVAGEYLGLSREELLEELRDGKTPAELARERGKSVDGLVEALRRAVEERLDDAVEEGKLTDERRRAILERVERRLEALVNGERPRWWRGPRRGGPGFRGPPRS